MKTKYILGAALVLGTLSLCTSCENYFDEKYMDNGDPQIQVVKTYDYTLAAGEYKTIAENKTNKAYAVYMDSVNHLKNRYQKALERVGQEGCFNNNASADMYVPAFIYAKYPQLDPGSIFNVTYLTDDGLPAYLLPYNAATQLTLDIQDESEISGKLPQPEEGQVIGVVYNGNEVLYTSEDGYTWTPATLPANMYMLPAEANGQVEKWLQNKFPYAVADQVVAVIWYDSAAKHYVAYEFHFDGSSWKADTGVVEETMSFALADGWKANLSTYYRQAIAGEGNLGKITLHHYDLEDGITYIWRFDNLYGMRGSSYVGGPHYGEGWFVTPKIKLKNAVAPALSFDHALNYGPLDETREQQITVWVSTDYTDDARSATWTQLPWNKWDGEKGVPDANSWTYYNSGRMDLSAWNGQTIYIGFRYKTESGQTCPTWEVKNILVNEPEEEEGKEEKQE